MSVMVKFGQDWVFLKRGKIRASNPAFEMVMKIAAAGYRPTPMGMDGDRDLDFAEYLMASAPGVGGKIVHYRPPLTAQKGGAGSGHWGHAGRPGKRGGSVPMGTGLTAPDKETQELARQRLQEGFYRYAKRMNRRFLDELRGDADFMGKWSKIKTARERFVEGVAEYNRAIQPNRDLIEQRIKAESKANAANTIWVKANDELNKAIDVREALYGQWQAALGKTPGSVKNLAEAGHIEKRLKIVQNEVMQRQADVEQKRKDWNRAREESESLSQQSNDFWKKHGTEVFAAEKKQEKGVKEYMQAIEDHGQACMDRAMQAASKNREKIYSLGTRGQIGRMDAEASARRNELMTELEGVLETRKELMEMRQDPSTPKKLVGEIIKKQQELAQRTIDLNREIGRFGVTTNALFSAREAASRLNIYQPQPGRLEAVTDDKRLEGNAQITSGLESANLLIGAGELLDDSPVRFERAPQGTRRAYASGSIYLTDGSMSDTVVHEIGHIWEERDPLVHALAVNFLKKRTVGGKVEKLRDLRGTAYDEDELTIKDKFLDPYMGKQYVDSYGSHHATEIVSMGLQKMQLWSSSGRDELATKDPEYYDFMYALLRMGSV